MPGEAFTVTHATWLKTETDRVEAIILTPRFWHRNWTPSSLHAALVEIGLNYTLPQIEEINEELHTRGIVEDVGGG